MFDLTDKIIIVTGGTGILGGAFVEIIAEQNATVGILGRNKQIAEERAHHIISNGGKAFPLIADVTNEKQIENVKNIIQQKYRKLDGIVNAAGGNMPEATIAPNKSIFDFNLNALQDVMQLNLWGTILPTQIFGPLLLASNSASIVNVSSVSSTHALTRVLGYSMAKAAIDNYTRWMCVEIANRYEDKIRINSLVPGFFLTEQNKNLLTNEDGSYTERGNLIVQNTPFKRFGNPKELQGAVAWLLSDASSFVNGTSIVVDGGFSAYSGV
jgi:NAD(P)-dependent dehydrogenase (short-subunit alcohol dehydrogenase family)